MGDTVSAVCSVAQILTPVFRPLAAHASYICKFNDNLKELSEALEDLNNRKVYVQGKVGDVELQIRRQLPVQQVKAWLLKVETIVPAANQLVSDASAVQQGRSTSCCCSSTIISTYRCGKKIPPMLSEVQRLISENLPAEMTRPATLPVVEEQLAQQRQTVGLDTKLNSTWTLLMEDSTTVLGLYGMGGVGKTTLLTRIHNKFVEVVEKFDVVIWIDVSKHANVGQIQDDISKRLGLYDEHWCNKTQREKANHIHWVLKDKKPRFVLVLDDLWEKVTLTEIGVPVIEKGYKIVFTTRSKDVCQRMKAINIEVECLGKEYALDLLKQISGIEASTGEERLVLAEKIARKCYGLPLALEVIGNCLSSKTTDEEWSDVLDALDSHTYPLGDMEKKVFPVLKVSYDRLEEKARLCLQYCTLFPMAYNIHKDELVEYWIGEGIIDEKKSGRGVAEFRGFQIIETLVMAGLLLTYDKSKQKVYMPNMIRDMALWIVTETREEDMFIVETDAGLRKLPYVDDWTIVSKMSLMNNEIQDIPDDAEFPDQARLITLFLQNNKLRKISCQFFLVMSALVVLDLSSNPKITKLPDEISDLVSLRYLKLLGTRIMHLPEGFRKLLKLIHLDLESTSNLSSISQISGLLKLQVLRFYDSAAALDISLLKYLEDVRALQLLTVTVREVDVLKAFLGSTILPKKLEGLYLDTVEVSGVSGKSFAATFGELDSLSKLRMTDCDIKESETEWEENRSHQSSSPSSSNQITPSNPCFKKLSDVVLYSCEGIQDLTWLIYAPNLESLNVKNSPKMTEVISKEKARDGSVKPFLKLQVLELGFLNELESIYWSPLSFPCLQKFNITKCPKLRKLPLNTTSVERIDALRIEVDDGWLDGVEWESEAEERFRHAFHIASVY